MDEAFLALPLRLAADAALSRARERGAPFASCRIQRTRTARLQLADGTVREATDTATTGLGVRVAYGGNWGFAAVPDLTTDGAVAAVDRAITLAAASGPARGTDLADEPVHRDVTWSSPCRIDPFDVPEPDRADLLAGWSARLLRAPHIRQVLAILGMVRDNVLYADLAGTVTCQQRVRVHPLLFVFGHDDRTGVSASLRSMAPPTARGWEYLLGEGWDWDAELAELTAELAGKLRATPVRPGTYDVVMDPSHLWLTLHESVGHATELDRALGHEMGYAGGTFARPADLGTLRFGSPLMTVTADRTARHGLATVGYDDEGVAAQSWDLVRDGVLTGFQLDRRTAAAVGAPRSTGCATAETAAHAPLARMPNVSLQPQAGGPDLAALIGSVGDGIYLAGSGAWSIDTWRRSFEFTAQRAYRIHQGRLSGQLSGLAYRGATRAFWGGLSGLGGPQTYRLFGADLCGKGQPVQISAAGHGCPAALFSGVGVVHAGSPG